MIRPTEVIHFLGKGAGFLEVAGCTLGVSPHNLRVCEGDEDSAAEVRWQFQPGVSTLQDGLKDACRLGGIPGLVMT
jgi:hypothetical protein